MCYILATYELKKEHLEKLKNRWQGNPHGAGLAWHVKKGARSNKGYFTWAELEEKLKRHLGQTVIVHLRNATHGVINTDNCHPFLTCENEAFMAHNGILPAPWSSNRLQSDSAAMAKMLEPISIDQLVKDRRQIGQTIGYNKLVFLTAKGRIIVVNDDLGEWIEPNKTWVSAKETVGGYGSLWRWDSGSREWTVGKKKEKAYKVIVNGKVVKDTTAAAFDEGPNKPNDMDIASENARHAKMQAEVDEYIKNLPR